MKISQAKLLTIVACVVGVLLLAFVGFTTYQALNSPKKSQEKTQAVTTDPKTADLLATLQKKTKSSNAWGSYIVALNDEAKQPSNTYVYTTTDTKMPIGLQPDASLRITQAQGEPYSEANLAIIHQTVTTVLEANNIKAESFSTPTGSLGSYSGGGLHCSLGGTSGATYVSLACIIDQRISRQLTTVASLLRLHSDTAQQDIAYLRFASATNTQQKNSVAAIDSFTTQNKKVHSYIYTAENEAWTYHDDPFTAVQKSGGGKTISTPKLDALLKDPTYGPSYTSLLGGVKKTS